MTSSGSQAIEVTRCKWHHRTIKVSREQPCSNWIVDSKVTAPPPKREGATTSRSPVGQPAEVELNAEQPRRCSATWPLDCICAW